MPKYRLVLAIFIVILMMSAWAHATTLIYLSVEDLTNLSDDVVIGEVVQTEPYLEPDGQTIFTAVHLEVLESIQGDAQPGDEVTLHHLGGEVDGIALRYAAMPVFHEGETVAVFLKRLGPETFALVGLGQGKMDVVEENGRFRAVRYLDGLRFINPEFPGRGPVEEPHGDEAYTLGELRSRVQDARGPGLIRRSLR